MNTSEMECGDEGECVLSLSGGDNCEESLRFKFININADVVVGGGGGC